MVYKWLSLINGGQTEIKSFVAKPVMFLVCEANNKDIEADFLLYYFISKINVIESISHETRSKLIQKIQEILQNIEYHLPSLSEIEEWTFEVIGITKSLLKLTVDLGHQN